MNLRERDAAAEELLDGPGVEYVLLEQSLRDLSRMSALLTWTKQAVKQIAELMKQYQLQRFSVLDVGTGAGNIPIALARWARLQGLEAQITATDLSEQVVEIARLTCAGFPEIQLEVQNGLALTYEDQSFDLVHCQGVLHHFAPDEAQVLLKEMARVARHAVIVTDLRRGRAIYMAAWLVMQIVRPSRITRLDGLASIRRSYIPSEVRALAERAGLHQATLRTTFPVRQILIWQR
jgi:ubiquinone/menaquinone biosynthesis C-methylase UbiE